MTKEHRHEVLGSQIETVGLNKYQWELIVKHLREIESEEFEQDGIYQLIEEIEYQRGHRRFGGSTPNLHNLVGTLPESITVLLSSPQDPPQNLANISIKKENWDPKNGE